MFATTRRKLMLGAAALLTFAVAGTASAQPHEGPVKAAFVYVCLLYTSPSPRDLSTSRMPSSA